MRTPSLFVPVDPLPQSGFTIIELMVGMLVGLIATVVMFQVFAISEGQKRTTTGAGDAQQNGVGSVFLIERDARMAGFGMNYLPAVGCPVSGWHSGKSFGFQMAPYVIVDGAAGSADTITLAYGDTRSFASPVKMAADMAVAAPLRLYNRFGLQLGDLFVIASTSNSYCTLYQVQATPGSDGVSFGNGGFTDAAGIARTTEFNAGPGGNTVTFPSNQGVQLYKKWEISKRLGSRVINLGQAPVVVTYLLKGNQLIAKNVLNPDDKEIVISDGVVQFQVQYAFDFDGDGSIDPKAKTIAVLPAGAGEDYWADSLPANPTPAMWAGLIGIRFAIVSRGSTPEKVDAAGKCPTETLPRWLAADRDIDITADANWKCYRYRVFELTVPARNLAWTPDETL